LQLGRTLLNRVLTWLHHELPLAYRLAAPQRWAQDNRFCVMRCRLFHDGQWCVLDLLVDIACW
jgi:hypothetical protein